MSGFTSDPDVRWNGLVEVMLDPVASDGNCSVFQHDHQRRSLKIVTKIMIRKAPPVTPPAIAPTFVRDPPPSTTVKVAGGGDHVLPEVVDDGVPVTGRRDDSVPLVR